MFDVAAGQSPGGVTSSPSAAAVVTQWTSALQDGTRPVEDSGRIDLLRALEDLKNAAAAAQADVTRDLDASQRALQAAAGDPARQRGRGVAAQIALARRESHHRGTQHLGLARVLHEMPQAASAFRRGRISEWRMQLLLRETACLSAEHRLGVDEELASDPARLEAMGERELVKAAMTIAVRLDAAAVAKRRRRAEKDRRVTVRPAPDTMAYVTGLLPVAQGVAVLAALTREADRLRAAGDERTRGQIMADTLVDRVVSPVSADPGSGKELALAINLVVSDSVLLGASDESAVLMGHGEIPGELARELVARNLSQGVRTTLRRVYANPETGALVAMDSRSRRFPTLLGHLIDIRDRTCRTPWCDAPVRHRDHVQPADAAGPTSFTNGQGLCEACKHAKQSTGWHARPRPAPRHTVETTTPTGHRYESVAPRAPTPLSIRTPAERRLADIIWAA